MTKQEFEQFNIELEASGQTLRSYMDAKGLPIHRYYYWKKKYTIVDLPEQPSGFIQIGPGEQAKYTMRLEYPNGVVISFQSYPGSKTLLKLVNPKH